MRFIKNIFRGDDPLFLFLLISLGLLLLDAVIYPGFSLSYLGHQQVDLFLKSSLLCVFLISMPKWHLKESHYYFWSFVIAPTITALAIFLPVVDHYTHANFSFSMIHLHPEALVIPSLFSMSVALVTTKKSFIEKWPNLSIFFSSFFFVALIIFFGKYDTTTIYWHLKMEDSLFEYITAFAYWGVAFVGWENIKMIKSASSVKYRVFLLAISIIMIIGGLFIGFEEISWGQRILGVDTPESWAEVNTQQEITIHNHEAVIGYVYYGYLILSSYCAFSWIVLSVIKNFLPRASLEALKMIVPPWYLFWFFIPSATYVFFRIRYGYIRVGDWEEVTEMVLGLGLLFFVLIRQNEFFIESDNKHRSLSRAKHIS